MMDQHELFWFLVCFSEPFHALEHQYAPLEKNMPSMLVIQLSWKPLFKSTVVPEVVLREISYTLLLKLHENLHKTMFSLRFTAKSQL
jgi:hypothetical protein